MTCRDKSRGSINALVRSSARPTHASSAKESVFPKVNSRRNKNKLKKQAKLRCIIVMSLIKISLSRLKMN